MNYNYTFNKDESEYVNDLLSLILDNVDKEVSVRENMIRFCLQRSSIYEREKVEEDVDKIIHGVATFQNQLDEAKKNVDTKDTSWIMKQIDEVTKDLTSEQKYECMYYLLIGLKAVDYNIISERSTSDEFDASERIEELKQSVVYAPDGTLTDDDINELKALLVEAIDNSGIYIAGNAELATLIKELPNKKDAVNEFITSNWDDVEFKNYASLATYLAYVEGALPSIPEHVDPEVIATSVTAGIERDKIIKEASLGQITFEYACQILKIIGAILLVGLLLWLAINVITTFVLIGASIGALIGESFLSLIIGMIIGGFLGYKAGEGIISVGSETITVAGVGYDKVIQLVTNTYTKVSDYVKDNIIDPLKVKHGKFHEYINKKIMEGIIRVKTTRAEQNTTVEI